MPQANPQYEWLVIDNFTPGIISQVNHAYDSGSPVPSPLGAAQQSGTYGCIALASGGLGPIMGYTGTTVTATGLNNAFSGGAGTYWITGLIVVPRVAGGDELIYCIDNPYSSSKRNVVVGASVSNGAWTGRQLKDFNAVNISSGQQNSTFCFTGGLTTLLGGNVVTPDGSDVQGCVAFTAFAITSDASTGGSYCYFGIYPDPTQPSTTTFPHDYTNYLPPAPVPHSDNHSEYVGWMFTHSGRIVFAQADEYYWTSTSSFMASGYDQFYFTDPPNADPVYGVSVGTNSLIQDIIYIPEFPSGTGSFGSVSAGELFCVKHDDGGYIVSGDPTAPTVTWLGGVQPTYGADCMAANTPQGMIYMSNNNGAWLWNGGSQSSKVSTQLTDTFWQDGNTFPPNQEGPQFSLGVLGNLIFFPNNYVLDLNTGGWWILDNQAVRYVWYGTGSDGNTMYCAPASTTSASKIIAYEYKKTIPATTFSWTSYPLPPTVDPEYSCTIREVVIRSQGIGTITVTLTGVGGSTIGTVPASQTISTTTQPVRYLFDTGMIGAHDVYINVVSSGTGGNYAPVIYSIEVGYEQETRLNAT